MAIPVNATDMTRDADLERVHEAIEVAALVVEPERAPLFETDDDDLFEWRRHEESDLEHEPEGAFLD